MNKTKMSKNEDIVDILKSIIEKYEEMSAFCENVSIMAGISAQIALDSKKSVNSRIKELEEENKFLKTVIERRGIIIN